MTRVLAAILLALLAACGGINPPQPPVPPPIPPEPVVFFQDMLLRADGPSAFVDLEGAPVSFKGAVSCCMPPDWGGGSGWPFNVDPSWQDYAAEQFGANFFHARSGPFMVPGEDEFLGVGGPYLAVEGEKVDLNQFNQPWWDLVGSWIKYAGERGRYVEVDLIDGWYCKHAEWGDVKMPWMAQWNIQGENHAAGCSAVEILPDSVYDNFVRKQVQEFGKYGNVIWQDGNEIGGTGRYQPVWSLSLQARVRHWETEVGHGFVHMFGTNSGNAEVRGQVDYVEEHSQEPMVSPLANRITLVNEYNPHPAFDAVRMNTKRCNAQRFGTFWWYWRHSQTKEQLEQTAALYGQACTTGPDPQCPPDTMDVCNCYIGDVWQSCPQPPTSQCPKGQPQARAYWHHQADRWVADATPAVCSADWTPDCYEGRLCHPLGCEGDPQRFACEVAWMGGTSPVWQLKVESGTLRLVDDPWFGVVAGKGKGRLRWIYPNGNAVSKWLTIDK